MPISDDFKTHIDVLYKDFKKNQNSWFWWLFFPRELAKTLETYHTALDDKSKIQASIQLCEIYFSLWSITKWFFKILECFNRSLAVLALIKIQQAQLLNLQTETGQTIYSTVLTHENPYLFHHTLMLLTDAHLLDSKNCIDTLNHHDPINAACALGILQKHELLNSKNHQRILSHRRLPSVIASLLLLEQNQLLDGPLAQTNFDNIIDSKCSDLTKFIALHAKMTAFSQQHLLQLIFNLNDYTASYQNLFNATQILSQLGLLNLETWQAILKSETKELIDIIKNGNQLNYPQPIEFKAILEILSKIPDMSQDNLHTTIIALLDDSSPRLIHDINSILSRLSAINLLSAQNFRILVRHSNRGEINNALDFLQQTDFLNHPNSQSLFELIFNHAHPYPLTVCLNTLQQAKIFNRSNIAQVFKNPMIYEFTNAINVLINSNILDQNTFEFLNAYSRILLSEGNWLLWTKIPNEQLTNAHLLCLSNICNSSIPLQEKIIVVGNFLENFLSKEPTLSDELIDEAIAFFDKEYLKDIDENQLSQLIKDLNSRINLIDFEQFSIVADQNYYNIGGLSILHLLAISELLIKQSDLIKLAFFEELCNIESKLSTDDIAENPKMSFECLLAFLVKQQLQLQNTYQTHHHITPDIGADLQP